MAILYRPSLDPSRVYYGTDTRASELLFGAALAMVWPSRKLSPRIGAGARNTLDALGVAGLLAIALMIWQTDQYSSFLYRGGFVLLSIATVLVLAPLAHPACRLGSVLGWKPLRWVGVRSYGIYLWHFPIIVLTTPGGVANGRELLRAALQVAAIFGVSALSWTLSRGADPPRRARPALAAFARRRVAAGEPLARGLGASAGVCGHRPGRRHAPAWPGSTPPRPKARRAGRKKRGRPAPPSRRR